MNIQQNPIRKSDERDVTYDRHQLIARTDIELHYQQSI